MRHRIAIRHLTEYAAGTADPEIESAVSAHLTTCVECRRWLETHDLLAEELGREREDDRTSHPESAALALCAIRPEEVYESDRRDLREHLDSCARCRDEMRAVREALLSARPAHGPAESPAHAADSRGLSPRIWASAATIVGILLGSGFVLVFLLSDPRPTDVPPPRIDDGAATAADTTPALQSPTIMAGEDLEGNRVISAESLLVSDLTVKSGADVTFRSKRVVAFGSGFRVASGARLRVDTGDPDKREPPRGRHGLEGTDTDATSGRPARQPKKKGNQT